MSNTSSFDLGASRHIHIVAIGGAGMSAIAGVLLDMGHVVTGSDVTDSAYLQRVAEAGAIVWVGHDASRVPRTVDAIAISTAVPSDNPEVLEARRRGIPVLRRADVLRSIAATRRTIAVSGTHGKTTTSTLLALALEGGGLRPSWVIGAELLGRGNGAHWDDGEWFVVEADESDATFLSLGAECVLVTNVEPDHLETYGSWEKLQSAFDQFVDSAKTERIVCIDDVGGARLRDAHDVVGYGTSGEADYLISDVRLDRFRADFRLTHAAESTTVELPAPGMHNVRNAAGAMAMAHRLGVPLTTSAAAMSEYRGIGRRFQARGKCDDITFVDDYAHLPTEVRAVLDTARDGHWPRVIAVFQPHRFSRTEQVGSDFRGAFDAADLVVLTDVYSAGEEPRPGINGEVIRRAVESGEGHPPVMYVEDRANLASEVNKVLQQGDLCVTIGAGDITGLPDEILRLRES